MSEVGGEPQRAGDDRSVGCPPRTKNLILFGPRVRVRYGVDPLEVGLDVPCDPVANLSVVVEDLLAHVRWRGAPHAGYDAWAAGEPSVTPPVVAVSRMP